MVNMWWGFNWVIPKKKSDPQLEICVLLTGSTHFFISEYKSFVMTVVNSYFTWGWQRSEHSSSWSPGLGIGGNLWNALSKYPDQWNQHCFHTGGRHPHTRVCLVCFLSLFALSKLVFSWFPATLTFGLGKLDFYSFTLFFLPCML